MKKSEIAFNKKFTGYNCSEAVFTTYAKEFDIDETKAMKIACALGGGMGRMGEVCGALTGAFLIVGLKYGRSNPEDNESKNHTYDIVRALSEDFKQEFGSILCRDLMGCDINTEEGLSCATGKDLFHTICPKYVRTAAILLEKHLIHDIE